MRASILGVDFDRVTTAEAVAWAMAEMRRQRCAYVCTPNPEIVWACRRDKALRAAIAGADMTLADGVGIVWASQVLQCPVPERVSGYDFLLALLAKMEGRVFLLGGKPGVAEDAARRIQEQFPHVAVCGVHDGYFSDEEPILEAIRSARPDLLLVCLGSPKQELWMEGHRGQLPVGLMAGLGGCLDVLAGRKRRAPNIWIRLRLEWLYRLMQEPGRIKRQSRLPLFAAAVLKERMSRWRAES
ncbi:MAG: WecB/TagA/CpsF family glycosyltransferase [Oscillospiraceae bacterium]|nr:WecB/TagA/CpsF family glycosyltransferase [Oscillospiraceae bacterium]